MKSGRCGRSWEAEAARDGRLSGDALAAHRAHVAGCRDCGDEVRALAELARALRDDEAAPDEVSLRRLRQATLANAFERSRARPATRSRAAWALFGGALAATAIAVVLLADPLGLRDAPSIAVTPGTTGATWTRLRARDAERVELSDGVLSLVVHRRPHDRRVIVRVPDGEIEDYGTAFEVQVKAGRTVRIGVRQGAVEFRRAGLAAVRLSAGMAWQANEAAPATPPSARTVAPQPSTAGTPPPVTATTDAGNAAVQPAARARLHRATAPREPTAEAAEDAAYLRVLALLREGRGEEARVAAAGYLTAFPNGFRRVEMHQIAHPAASGSPRP